MLNYAIASVILLVIDLTWLALYMGGRFGLMVQKIQGSPMVLNPIGGFIAYVLLCFGVTFFGVNNVDPENPLVTSLLYGGLWGLTAYGIYDFTNYAIFKDYELSTAIIDMLWGGILGATTTYATHKIISLINKN